MILTTEAIGEVARAKGSEPRASGHGSCDATLDIGSRTQTLASIIDSLLIEVTFVWLEVCQYQIAGMRASTHT